MSRIKEGTTAMGFRCDANGCSSRATHSPVLVVPYKGVSIHKDPTAKRPMIAFVDRHACPDHFGAFRIGDVLVDEIKRQFRRIADENRGSPDFDRAFVRHVRVISAEYQQFQEKSGLVPPGDADADGRIIIPNVVK